jgi:hypothetical protein
MELYLHSPLRLHGVVLNEAEGQLCLSLKYRKRRLICPTTDKLFNNMLRKHWNVINNFSLYLLRRRTDETCLVDITLSCTEQCCEIRWQQFSCYRTFIYAGVAGHIHNQARPHFRRFFAILKTKQYIIRVRVYWGNGGIAPRYVGTSQLHAPATLPPGKATLVSPE